MPTYSSHTYRTPPIHPCGSTSSSTTSMKKVTLSTCTATTFGSSPISTRQPTTGARTILTSTLSHLAALLISRTLSRRTPCWCHGEDTRCSDCMPITWESGCSTATCFVSPNVRHTFIRCIDCCYRAHGKRYGHGDRRVLTTVSIRRIEHVVLLRQMPLHHRTVRLGFLDLEPNHFGSVIPFAQLAHLRAPRIGGPVL